MRITGAELPADLDHRAWLQVLTWRDRTPDKEALVTPSGRFTYRQFVAAVFGVQAFMARQHVKPGDRVVLMLGNDWPYVLWYWAVIASGLVVVPLNTRLVRDEVEPILSEVEPALIVAEPRYREAMPSRHRFPVVWWDPHPLSSADLGATDVPWHPVGPDDVAVILYTSGTTGRPKGVMLTHRNIATQFYQASHALIPMQSDDRVISLYPLFHSAQHVFLQAPLTIGATAVVDAFHPDKVVGLVAREAISVFFGVPTMYQILLQDPAFTGAQLPRVRLLTYGASIMPIETITALKARFPGAKIFNLYGQTENSPAVSGLDDAYALTKPGSVGKPLPGMTISVVDDDHQEVAPGVVGEVVTQGINLMKGYYRQPDATADAIHDGWYHTGDLGYLDADGFLYIVDRKKDMIIRGGQNIYPAEVENVLYQLSEVVECAVVGLPHPIYGEEVGAFVILRPNSVLTEADLIAHARQHLAPYKVPVRVHLVAELPHNASGKILKRALRDLVRDFPG
ncbi:MAG: AMP-binding protein [Firmicutes bacterium]|nr:AMP-binding protein [Bacillota bacterium]